MNAVVSDAYHRRPGERFWPFVLRQFRPSGPLVTPFNVITVGLMLVAAVILAWRFVYGLGSVTNLNQDFAWGLWIGFDVMAGVAFAGGAYVLCFLVYILRMEKYHSIVRVTVLNGFLAYVFYASALLLDLGRPWNVVNPIIGNSFGLTSVLFLVAWHFMLYMGAELIEFSPAIAEWVGFRKLHKVLTALTVGTVVFGITLSTLHQSALGALYLMAKPKVHPLWYSEFIPVLFFVSSIFAGMAMVIFEGGISAKVFADRTSDDMKRSHHGIVIGLARLAGGAMFVYLFLQVVQFVHEAKWNHFEGGWAAWWLVEMLGLTAIPMVLFILGSTRKNMAFIKTAAILTLLGVLLNRLNLSVIAFKWYAPVHYVPSWQELVVSAAVLSAELWVFRWIVRRMPVMGGEPAWAKAHATQPATVPAVPGAVPAMMQAERR
jgi:Ni/Fe-hydrogenase subunit HybB-like protein